MTPASAAALPVLYIAVSGVEAIQAAQLITVGQRIVLGALPLAPVVQLLLIRALDVAVVLYFFYL